MKKEVPAEGALAVAFTWKQWLLILPACVAFSCLILCISTSGGVALWGRAAALGGLMVAAWAVYFWQRVRRAALAETAALLGLWAGVECYLMLRSVQQLGDDYPGSALLALLLVAPLSFLTQQRLIIGVVPLVLLGCVAEWVAPEGALAVSVFSMAFWLLGERWRTSRSSRYRGYSWVGVPWFFLMWVGVAAASESLYAPPDHTAYALGAVAVAAALFTALRPRGGWELPWPLCVGTCLLPLMSVWELHYSLTLLVMAAYAVLMIRAAVRQARRGWLVLGGGLVVLAVLFFYCCRTPSTFTPIPVAVVSVAAVAWWAGRRMPPRAPEPPALFPVARRRLWVVAGLVCGQLGWLLYLYVDPQAELRAAPKALMPAQWDHPRKFRTTKCPLRIRETLPLAAVGGELIGKPVAAFIRQGEDGLWHMDRIAAVGSPEDAPREGELRMPAHAARYGESVECTLSFKQYPSSPWQDDALYHRLHERRKELRFTAEVAFRRKRGPIITRFYVNGEPL